jgi:hypothetical protein
MPIKFSSSSSAAAPAETDPDFTRIDVTDGTWATFDPDGTASNITNVGGINKADLGTDDNDLVTDGCVFYKELKNADGSSIDFLEKPVYFHGYIHLPSIGWATTGTQGGGDNRPAVATRVYCLVGLMTDPEELPTPQDILGVGINTHDTGYRNTRMIVRNISNSGGNPSVLRTNFASITDSDATAGKHSINRVEFDFEITRDERLSASGTRPADPPYTKWAFHRGRYDNGDASQDRSSYVVSQKWGATRTNKLYVWVSIGRAGAVGNSQSIDFDCYFKCDVLTSGTNPSGETQLT